MDPTRTAELNIGIGVVAHVSRIQSATRLADTVGAHLAVDDGTLGCEGNHKTVLAHLATLDSEWSVVLEDDAQPVDGFTDQLPMVLNAAPTNLVSLYLGRQRPPQFQSRIASAVTQADTVGAHWLTSRHLMHAVAYAIRTTHIPNLLACHTTWPIDQHITRWLTGRRMAYCWPSIVNHLDGPTIAHHPDGHPRIPGRTAWRTGTRNTWHNTTVKLT